MKKMQKYILKFLCCLLLFSACLGLIGIVSAKNIEGSPNVEKIDESIEMGPLAINWRSILGKAFIKVIGSANIPFDYPAITNYGASRDTAHNGSETFNDGSDGFNTVKKEIYAQRVGHEIEMWGNSQQVIKTGKIGVVLRESSNGIYRINRTVGHNQYSWYKIPAGGTGHYEAQYNSTQKHKWILWIGYWHWSNNLPPITSYISSGDINTGNYEFVDIENYRFLVPSNGHVNTLNIPSSGTEKKGPISFAELHDQFYDDEHELLVDVAKDYNPGETIYINDNISDMYYNEEDNTTKFLFVNKDEYVEILFDEDLTERFNIGENVTFKFKLMRISEEHDFVVIDYNKLFMESDTIPKIDQFLSK